MPDEVPAVLERIESRLERVGLSPEQACPQAGLPQDFLGLLRAGKAAVPRGRKLVRLAEALSTSVSFLVGLDPDTPPPELLEEDQGSFGLLAGDEEGLLRAYRRLDLPAKAAVLLVVRKMAGPDPAPDEVPARVVRRRG